MNAHSPVSVPLDVIVVGAGLSGIGMAARLVRDCPGKTFAVLDRRQRAGGTWDLFRYPGVRSDSDMYTLGYEFEPWKDDKSIAAGATIRDYLEHVAESHGLRPHIRFGHKVIAANWNSAAALWEVSCEDEAGQPVSLSGRFLYLGSGYYDYDTPYDAAIPGLSSFGGKVIHPQFWPADFDYTGRHVVVIGSGATAVTLVPSLTDKAASTTMLQRTPTWYGQSPSRDQIALFLRKIMPERWAYAITRWKNVQIHQYLFKRARSRPEKFGAFLLGKVRDALGHAYKAEDFTPPYNPWEQRLCLVPDGDLFAAIKAGKAKVVTGHIDTVDKSGITLKDGRHLDADVLVTATGLQLAIAGKIALSQDGQPVNMAERYWYRSSMFSNLPNLAASFGYLNAGWTLRVDIVADRLVRLLKQMDAWGVNVVTAHLPEGHGLIDEHAYDYFSSGYLKRGKSALPKSATTAPWQFAMDYFSERRQMREDPLDDGVLQFARAGVAAAPALS